MVKRIEQKLTSPPPIRWRAVWMALHDLEYGRLNAAETKARLLAAGLPRAGATKRVMQVIRDGHFLMGR